MTSKGALPKKEKYESKKVELGSEVSIKRMNGKMHDTINMINITLKSEVESIDALLKKIPGVI
jgi:hypothetical protein